MVKRNTLNTINFKNLERKGCGLLNTLINKLPIELHIPSYNYCGPGTKLNRRLGRGDKGINPLDEACKDHDIAYSKYSDLERRHAADKVLANKALSRFKNSDSSVAEKLASLAITGIMKAKTKLGMGMRRKRRCKRSKKGGQLSFKNAVSKARKGIVGKKFNNIKNAVNAALLSIKKGKRKVKEPTQRIIPIPKSGGILPLIPIFAGLSALGALSGGAAGIAQAVNNAKNAQKKLEEQKRHNNVLEKISIGKGLYLKPYKKGCGLFLKPYPKNC